MSDFGAMEGIGSGSGAFVHLSLTSCRSPHSAPATSPTIPLAKSDGEYSWNACTELAIEYNMRVQSMQELIRFDGVLDCQNKIEKIATHESAVLST